MEAGAELRTRWAAHLFQEWEWFNTHFLREALKPPVFEVSEHAGRLGHWDSHTRTLSISGRHILEDPWLAVVETLRHEMAHQYAHEVLGASGEAAHGDHLVRERDEPLDGWMLSDPIVRTCRLHLLRGFGERRSWSCGHSRH